MANIHPLATVHPNAKLGENVEVGPYAYIEEHVEIGDGCRILPHATIFNYVKMGRNCTVFPGAVVGAVPQDLKFEGEITYVEIGDNVNIRECATINRGTKASGRGVTKIGKYAFLECSSLNKVDIPEGVTKIDKDALSDCKSLKKVSMPERFKGKENEILDRYPRPEIHFQSSSKVTSSPKATSKDENRDEKEKICLEYLKERYDYSVTYDKYKKSTKLKFTEEITNPYPKIGALHISLSYTGVYDEEFSLIAPLLKEKGVKIASNTVLDSVSCFLPLIINCFNFNTSLIFILIL